MRAILEGTEKPRGPVCWWVYWIPPYEPARSDKTWYSAESEVPVQVSGAVPPGKDGKEKKGARK